MKWTEHMGIERTQRQNINTIYIFLSKEMKVRETKLIDTQFAPRDTIQDWANVKKIKEKFATLTMTTKQLHIPNTNKGLQVMEHIYCEANKRSIFNRTCKNIGDTDDRKIICNFHPLLTVYINIPDQSKVNQQH